MPWVYQWDAATARRHKRRNRLQSLLLLCGMVGLLSACGWIIAGGIGVFWALFAGVVGLVVIPRVAPGLVLRLYRARPIPRWQVPQLHAVVDEICAAAGLEPPPELYYVPSPMLNAFTVGSVNDAAIALTDGMLRHLDLRELAGVLAHEISHIRNGDIWIMSLADTISRLTRVMAMTGILLLLISLPAAMMQGADVPWLLVALLTFAPTIAALLQLALSRTREFDADLNAAHLTGDPVGLAAALEKMERRQGRLWESILMPGRGIPDPSLLRTHPATSERIERLSALRVPVRIATHPISLPLPYAQPTGWRIRRR